MGRRTKGSKPSTSRFLGVYFDHRRQLRPWRVFMAVDGKRRHVGSYAEEEEAARAYDVAVRLYGKPGAAVNFLGPVPSATHCTIPLTRGRVAIVDTADYECVSAFTWFAHQGSKAEPGYAARTVNGQTIPMHRFIFGLATDDHRQVDHINGNTLDNRRCNLRVCLHAENSRNRRADRGKTFKGIRRKGNKYQARITADGQQINLGHHSTAEDAARAYDTAARQYHGEYARLNFPVLDDSTAVGGNHGRRR